MARTILVVDDSPAHLKLMQSAIEGRGYEILTAADGEEALHHAQAFHPDVILLDVVLPKKNGYQVCRQLKAAGDTRAIKIIMVSSKAQDSDRYWGMKQGADGYVTKPFEPADLLAAVESAL
ncbi:response regulator [uncultured Paludibaculum sp.]|uniref:response regulator transcription factor n=1 Tax=uncultured Paludibaculum sp. TaxID=1765020 RepID=UPI002AAAA007|nr:response regulator [uncultured Paludibaculum sp.]